jgi:hypothetical protein
MSKTMGTSTGGSDVSNAVTLTDSPVVCNTMGTSGIGIHPGTSVSFRYGPGPA